MIIRRMTACFGRLERETLTLREGLNVLQIPNEGGKSTWSEFLLAMLYGVDTAARERGGALPVKTKYLPWSGRPMEGSVELTHNGRNLLLVRESTPKAPLSRVTLTDTDTGTALSYDGERLVGAEKSVYERSGFLRQQQLAVTKDGALEQRLNSLITAGSEDYSYLSLSDALRRLQNSCRHNKTGKLPEVERALAQTQEQLACVRELQAELASLAEQEHDCRKERALLQARLERLSALARKQQTEQAEAAVAAAREDRAQWARICAEAPPPEVLERLERELAQLNEQAQTAAQALPQGLRGSPEQAARDAERVRALRGTKPRWLPPLLLALGAAALLAGFFVWTPLCIAGGALLLAGAGLLLFRHGRRTAALEILRQYGVPDADALQRLAEEAKAARQAQESAALAVRKRRDAFLAEVQAYLPGCGSAGEAAEYLSSARQSQTELRRAEQAERLAQERLSFSSAAPPPETEVRREAETRLESCEQRLSQLRSETDRRQGALSQLGDAFALCAELERLSARRRELLQTEQALILAQTVLREADEALRAEFAPMLCEQTGKLFSALTDGRYDRVLLDRSFVVSVCETGGGSPRSLSRLSAGTQEQLYLALRLAICKLLLPDAPLVLDDALVFFDDRRAAQALKVLKAEAKTRQILLFTCQSREKRLLESL